ncbi:hypothetical protein Kpho02_62530 [Kitasatospora phosalacinea]|uniref:Uncharacterized protein n=1 Tax=Kitasatospora phosalacinea TaxID=2065 RepID=A0A9W6V6A1_9ACTN|nr:hypothetical protein [Kitasatospora phosalacinea]GLW73955.1 hypothetical protein Kpho02_62530 [Kitasatospora phosalacinea]
MGVQHWPEGREADPEAARERYRNDLREALAEGGNGEAEPLRVADGHLGLTLTVALAGLSGRLAGPACGAVVAAAGALLFVAALAVQYARGHRGRAALRRAYARGFGWWKYAS